MRNCVGKRAKPKDGRAEAVERERAGSDGAKVVREDWRLRPNRTAADVCVLHLGAHTQDWTSAGAKKQREKTGRESAPRGSRKSPSRGRQSPRRPSLRAASSARGERDTPHTTPRTRSCRRRPGRTTGKNRGQEGGRRKAKRVEGGALCECDAAMPLSRPNLPSTRGRSETGAGESGRLEPTARAEVRTKGACPSGILTGSRRPSLVRRVAWMRRHDGGGRKSSSRTARARVEVAAWGGDERRGACEAAEAEVSSLEHASEVRGVRVTGKRAQLRAESSRGPASDKKQGTGLLREEAPLTAPARGREGLSGTGEPGESGPHAHRCAGPRRRADAGSGAVGESGRRRRASGSSESARTPWKSDEKRFNRCALGAPERE